ncbi:hypothetical protein JCM10213_003971 [Rhodosporidiobolus nylandii]
MFPFFTLVQLSGATEYASGGAPVVAVVAREAVVVLAITVRGPSRLEGEEARRKTCTLGGNDSVLFAFSGFAPDAQHLHRALCAAEDYKSVEDLATHAASLQYDRLSTLTSRPLALSSVICGFSPSSPTPSLWHISPSSLLSSFSAVALGENAENRQVRLDERWTDGMQTDEAVELAMGCLRDVERLVAEGLVEVTVVERQGVRKLPRSELLSRLAPTPASTEGRSALPPSPTLAPSSASSPFARLIDT